MPGRQGRRAVGVDLRTPATTPRRSRDHSDADMGWRVERPAGPDRANLPDRLAIPGFFRGSRGWGPYARGGRSHSPPYGRASSTSRAHITTGHAGRTAPPGRPVALVTGTRSLGRTLSERHHRTPLRPGRHA